MEKVSIIIPVYGVEDYLAECLESIIHQTYKNLEIIVIDDESPDTCPKICDEFAERDNRIKVIHQKNKGAAGARNTGIEVATGSYICFVDSDDKVKEDYVKILVTTLEENNADIVECSFEEWYPDEKIPWLGIKNNKYSNVEYLRCFLSDWTCGLIWNKLFHINTLKDVRFEEGHKIDDEFFTYKTIMNAKKVVTINQKLCLYRMRASGVMQSRDIHEEKMIQDRLEYLIERYELVSKKYRELKGEYLDNLQDNLIRLKRESFLYKKTYRRVKRIMKQYLKEVMKSNISWRKKYSFVRGLLFEGKKENKMQQVEHRDLFA